MNTDDVATPSRDDEVVRRRAIAGIPLAENGAWALALSGGGIRSATFCLGLVRGLAKNQVLKNFDYLSTVSGGGYLGASLGRLYGAGRTAAQVEDGVAKDNSLWLWWLRNNGRYLTPAGARDLGFAGASIIRGVISTHIEIGILITLLAALVLLPHFLLSIFPPLYTNHIWDYNSVSWIPSAWGWLVLLPAWWSIYQILAYWYTREKHTFQSLLLIALAATGYAIAAAYTLDYAFSTMSLGWFAATTLLLAPPLAVAGVMMDRLNCKSVSAQRLARTKRLAWGLWGVAIFLALGCLDWVTWQLTKLFWQDRLPEAVLQLGGTILVAAAIGRFALPELQRAVSTSKNPRINLRRLINLTGITLGVVVAIFWTTVLSVLVFPASYRMIYRSPDMSTIDSGGPASIFALIVTVCLIYVIASRHSFDLLNLASLHNFYRARIERAYVSSGNCSGNSCRFPGSALDEVTRDATTRIAPLSEAVEGDDVELLDYGPHKWGGPIHLINCCVNQTVDDRTGLYNADRKGVALTMSSLGIETGTQPPISFHESAPPGLLSKWIAISGAAAGTGMGSQTTPGLAALLFLSGIRLGYWTTNLLVEAPIRSKGLGAAILKHATKPVAIVAESLARFPGLLSPVWYVSDGGHFDNTGIHALLKRKAGLIIAADCGADPKYLFADIESLVRKAKIDYGTSIDFVKSDSPELDEHLRGKVGTPETIHPHMGEEWLLLAKVSYPDATHGTLIVVKPRRIDSMPFDLVAYADRNQDFPQQTTGDQFFDEAQWEAYHQLGLLMGSSLDGDLVEAAERTTHRVKNLSSSLRLAENPPGLKRAKADRKKRAGLAVRATVGAGISLSVIVAAWQGFEQYRQSRATRAQERQPAYESQLATLHEVLRDRPLDVLSGTLFANVARESKLRSDGAVDSFMQAFLERCEGMEQMKRDACRVVYVKAEGLVPTAPGPFYDYWFKDKEQAFNDLEAKRRVSGATPVEKATQVSSAPNASEALTRNRNVINDLPSTKGNSPSPKVNFAAATAPCSADVRLFTHIHDEPSRATASLLSDALMRATGATSNSIENVTSTARNLGRPAPRSWPQPTLVYSKRSSQACLEAAKAVLPGRIKFESIEKGRANTLELWLPYRSDLALAGITPQTLQNANSNHAESR